LKKTNMAELLKVVEDKLKVIRVRSEFM
jgi:hypothetical protein